MAQALVSDLSDAEARIIAKRPTENIEAYQHYMKGRYFWNKRTVEDAKKAIVHFEQAIAIDPTVRLLIRAWLIVTRLRMVLPPAEALPKAKAAALKAVELDDTLADAHASLSLIKALADFDQAGVEVLTSGKKSPTLDLPLRTATMSVKRTTMQSITQLQRHDCWRIIGSRRSSMNNRNSYY